MATNDARDVPTNQVTTTDVRYFNGVGLSGWKDIQAKHKTLPPLLSDVIGSYADSSLYVLNCLFALDLPERVKEAYR